jgi:hypothetical protein
MLFLFGVLAWAQAPPTAIDLNRISVGSTAPDFELPSPSGSKLKLSSLRGKNVVLIFYRGYW